MPETATTLEVSYTALMCLALIATAANFAWAWARVIELERSGKNGVVRIMRRGARLDEGFLLVVCICLVVIGVNALLAPSNPRATGAVAIISGGAFIVMSLAILALSIAIRIRPAQLKQAYDEGK